MNEACMPKGWNMVPGRKETSGRMGEGRSYLLEVLQVDLCIRLLADVQKLLFEHWVLLLDTQLESVNDFFLRHVLAFPGFVLHGLGSEITSGH